ncbi:hypothetical protein [Pantoea agglomerans]|uniref:Lysogenic conversion protein n=2 Tax=Enterobacter agglomerans TaxID=549 RepID=A0AAN2K6I7_ENTAG|nr:hypothetical protein [Pantoea agglomerans]CAH6332970.1 lysogenic conversion protein [Pantoea agglomerans]
MMTNPLSWENWSKVYLNKKHNKRASLERWGLRNLHSVETLDHIVSEVKKIYLNNNPHIKVSANSVWIDGTPQAKFTVSNYKRVYNNSPTISGNATQPNLKLSRNEVLNCELADLLFIFNEFNSQNDFKRVRAVLLQGKCSDKNNLLPDGPSTEKERKLLESVNRNEKLTLYPGTKAFGKAIGSYTLGGNAPGLADCAKYLMMPKYETWSYNTPNYVDPYVTGWPVNSSNKSLGTTTNYLEAIIKEMLKHGTMGKDVKIQNGVIDRSCAWSRMIHDLLTSYVGVTMKGYENQKRVYTSSGHAPDYINSLGLTINSQQWLAYWSQTKHEHFNMYNSYFHALRWIERECHFYMRRWNYCLRNNIPFEKPGPVISTITVNIDYHEGEPVRD